MNWPGEELFRPINEGLSSLRDIPKDKEAKREKAEDRALKIREIVRKETKDRLEDLRLQNYIDAAQNSPLAQDKALAGAAAGVKQPLGPAMVAKVSPETFSNYKLQTVQSYMDAVRRSMDPKATPDQLKAVNAELDYYRTQALPAVGVHGAITQSPQEQFKKLLNTLPDKDSKNRFINQTEDSWNSVWAPFYKEQGMSDAEINALHEQGPSKWLGTYVGTGNVLTSMVKGEGDTLTSLDKTADYNLRMTKYLGSMSSDEIKSWKAKNWDKMSPTQQQLVLKAETLRGWTDSVERTTGKTLGGIFPGLPESVQTVFKNAPGAALDLESRIKGKPSEQVGARLQIRDQQRKQGAPRQKVPIGVNPADTGGSVTNRLNQTPTYPSGTSLRDMYNNPDGMDGQQTDDSGDKAIP